MGPLQRCVSGLNTSHLLRLLTDTSPVHRSDLFAPQVSGWVWSRCIRNCAVLRLAQIGIACADSHRCSSRNDRRFQCGGAAQAADGDRHGAAPEEGRYDAAARQAPPAGTTNTTIFDQVMAAPINFEVSQSYAQSQKLQNLPSQVGQVRVCRQPHVDTACAEDGPKS